ncbi:hypothetical protein N0V82_010005 [Gnomoniopsis sp. IMI 355080]|nr:hypothetical protein N0V82_010005 [Gnomoniopsis sp. IMI 355080]
MPIGQQQAATQQAVVDLERRADEDRANRREESNTLAVAIDALRRNINTRMPPSRTPRTERHRDYRTPRTKHSAPRSHRTSLSYRHDPTACLFRDEVGSSSSSRRRRSRIPLSEEERLSPSEEERLSPSEEARRRRER